MFHKYKNICKIWNQIAYKIIPVKVSRNIDSQLAYLGGDTYNWNN